MLDEIDVVVVELNVKGVEVCEMEMCFLGGDIVFEGQMDDGEEFFVLIVYLVDMYNELICVIEVWSNDCM